MSYIRSHILERKAPTASYCLGDLNNIYNNSESVQSRKEEFRTHPDGWMVGSLYISYYYKVQLNRCLLTIPVHEPCPPTSITFSSNKISLYLSLLRLLIRLLFCHSIVKLNYFVTRTESVYPFPYFSIECWLCRTYTPMDCLSVCLSLCLSAWKWLLYIGFGRIRT